MDKEKKDKLEGVFMGEINSKDEPDGLIRMVDKFGTIHEG